MANAEALYKTLDMILANLHAWNQDIYCSGTDNYHPGRFGECGTSHCIAGARCIMDGLLPVRRSNYFFVDPSTGREVVPSDYAQERFGLNGNERRALFHYHTDNPALLKQRVDEIVNGEWRDRVRD